MQSELDERIEKALKELDNSRVHEGDKRDHLVLFISSGALVLSVNFVSSLQTYQGSLSLAYTGWFFLVFSLNIHIMSFLLHEIASRAFGRAAQCARKKDLDQAKKENIKGQRYSKWLEYAITSSVAALVLGLTFLTIFAVHYTRSFSGS